MSTQLGFTLTRPPEQPKTPQYAFCTDCYHEWVAFYAPARVEEVVRFMKASRTCPACGSGKSALGRYVPPDRSYVSYEDWLENGDVGESSRTILFVLTGLGRPHEFRPPSDPSDFRRCWLLLRAFPELRPQFDRVADRFPAWMSLVARWDDIERTLASEVGDIAAGKGEAPNTLALMRELRGEK